MIRRDYILRQLEQFAAVLTRIAGLAKGEQWGEATAMTGKELQRLAGVEADALLKLSESELLARLIENEPAFDVGAKISMVTTLLKAEGDVRCGQGRLEESRAFYLKGLHLLLETFGRVEPSDRPDFVPTVEAFRIALSAAPLPVMTNAMLMRHYEQTGNYAGAEDALFEMLEAEPAKAELLEFGRSFYQRILRLEDDALVLGNLPRAEAQAGLAELEARKSRLG